MAQLALPVPEQCSLLPATIGSAVSSPQLHQLSCSLRAAELLSRRDAPAVAAPLPDTAVLAEYTGSLQRLASAEAAAANPSTSAAAAAVCSEFSSWLVARSWARGVTLLTCTPEDVAVFFESCWLRQHGSSQLRDGQLHASPSYLASAVSHLSGLFKRLGREGHYNHSAQVGSDGRVDGRGRGGRAGASHAARPCW